MTSSPLHGAWLGLRFGSLVFLLAACSVEPVPGQKAQFCEKLDGSDKYVADPNAPDFKATMQLDGSITFTFVDKLTGWKRTATSASATAYRCREWTEQAAQAK